MERNMRPRAGRLCLVAGMTLLLFAVQAELMRATLQYAR